jgi:hypothetical protein
MFLRGIERKIMRKLIAILNLFLAFELNAQFDRILTDPLAESASFTGSEAKKRITFNYSFEKRRNSQTLSYDFFDKRLGGAWGLRLSNNRMYFNNEANGQLAYALKFYRKNKKQREITWSPAVSMTYSRFYKDRYEEYYCFGCSFIDRKKIKDNFRFQFSLARNTKTFLTYFNTGYSTMVGRFDAQLNLTKKIDRNPDNKLSSTFSLTNKLFINSDNYLVHGILVHYYEYDLDTKEKTLIFKDFKLSHFVPQKQYKIDLDYAVKISKFTIQAAYELTLWKKEVSTAVNTNFYPIESSNLARFNNANLLVAYNLKNFELYTEATFGYEKSYKRITEKTSQPVTENENGTITGIETYPSTIVRFNYKSIRLGANYKF